jgi:alginate O-acetyltransferase complex protein AlgI
MHNQSVDLSLGYFWVIMFAAILLAVPIQNAALRRWALVAANVTFLWALLSALQFVVALAGLLVIYLSLQALPSRSWGVITAAAIGAATLVLFLVHKFPALFVSHKLYRLTSLLAAIGFSYVALRVVEVVRAVFEGRHPPPSLQSTINYLVPFHMLAAGPIQSFDEYATQPEMPPPPTKYQALRSTERIAWGMFKKFVLASTLQRLFLTGFRVLGWYFVVETQLFYIWLFLDFSALADIAVGIGGLLGVVTPENFDHPLLARDMINYWERWHISLSQFIRRNIFIPIQLQLARRTAGRFPLWCATIAFTVAFGLCGLWHAVSIRYLLWGLLNALGLVIANIYRYYLARRLGTKGVKRYLENRPIRMLATLVTFEFVAFSLAFVQVPL